LPRRSLGVRRSKFTGGSLTAGLANCGRSGSTIDTFGDEFDGLVAQSKPCARVDSTRAIDENAVHGNPIATEEVFDRRPVRVKHHSGMDP
jgi:hypothetical protein